MAAGPSVLSSVLAAGSVATPGVAVRSAGSGRLGGGTRLDTLKQALLDRDFTLCAREQARGLVVSAYTRKGKATGCRQPRP